MKRIKLVFGVNDFLVGGMQRQLTEQLKLYERGKFDIHLVTLFDFPDKPTFYDLVPGDVSIHRFRFRSGIDVVEWYRLYRLMRVLRPDIVVSSLFFANTVFRLLRFPLGYASIAREHNTYIYKPRWQRIFDRLLARQSFCIVGVSKTVADFTAAQEHIARDRFVVIENGVDVDAVRNRLSVLPDKINLRIEEGYEKVGMLLLNAARLTAQKDHRLLIDGFLQYHAEHSGSILVIVGDGALRNELAQQIRERGAEKSVKLLGHKNDIWKYYKMADAFVSASLIEGMSNAYLEALAAGLPVVSTKTAGTDQLIREGKNGFFISSRTPRDVAASLERLSSSDLPALANDAIRTARQFDVHLTVEKYSALFEKAVG
jgi:glycosyltransferase involved in cell wall biosynthesis